MSEPINLVHRCDSCGEAFPMRISLMQVNDERLCPACFEAAKTCYYCGRRIASNHRIYSLQGGHYCKRCHNALLAEEAAIMNLTWSPDADYGWAPRVKRIKEDV